MRGAATQAVQGRGTISGVAPYDAEGLDWFAGMADENHAEYHAAEQGRDVYGAYLQEHFLPVLLASPEEVAAALGGLVTADSREPRTEDAAQGHVRRRSRGLWWWCGTNRSSGGGTRVHLWSTRVDSQHLGL